MYTFIDDKLLVLNQWRKLKDFINLWTGMFYTRIATYWCDDFLWLILLVNFSYSYEVKNARIIYNIALDSVYIQILCKKVR